MILVSLLALTAAESGTVEDLRRASRYVEVKRASSAVQAQRLTLRHPGALWRKGMSWTVAVELAGDAPATASRTQEYFFHFRIIAQENGITTMTVQRADRPRAVAEMHFDARARLVRARDPHGLTGIDFFPAAVPVRENGDSSDEYVTADSLSRPVRVVWRQSAPWPALVHGAGGKARLLTTSREGQ